MPMNRRQFIKRGAGAVSVSLVLPKLWLSEARAQNSVADTGRRVFVVIQMAGGNDGLNTVVPYTDPRYYSLRPRIGFQESELTPTIISDQFALHPSMTALKGLYDAGKVAVVLGVGYPNPNLSHFSSMDIWETADTSGQAMEGWLGKYADDALVGKPALSAVSVGGALNKALFSDKVVIPNISSFASYEYMTDPKYQGDRNNQLNLLNKTYGRNFPAGTFESTIANTGLDAIKGVAEIQTAIANYSSTVTYPATPIASGLKMLAQVITTIPEANLLYVAMGGFDNHSNEVATVNGQINRLTGEHATLLGQFSDGVSAFYQDLTNHSLADQVVMMTWSEFGRRVGDNGSNGTDHGTAAPQFVIGNAIQGGKLYGIQPSLAVTDLDNAGNMKFQVDFRATYGTILDKWLNIDSSAVLGARYENVGFMG